jgi:hypothetical protein
MRHQISNVVQAETKVFFTALVRLIVLAHGLLSRQECHQVLVLLRLVAVDFAWKSAKRILVSRLMQLNKQ